MQIICILHAPLKYENKIRHKDEKKKRKKRYCNNGITAYQSPVYCNTTKRDDYRIYNKYIGSKSDLI